MNKSRLYCHGWGFDQNFWDQWFEPFHHIERGYFSESPSNPSSNNRYHTIIAHSLGLHHLHSGLLERCETLIILSGFQHFHYEGSPVMVKSMLRKIKRDPHAVLDQFYRMQGLTYTKKSDIHVNRLYQDLLFLNESYLQVETLQSIPDIVIIHGSQDTISPFNKALKWYNQLPQSTLINIANGGHALPFTHAEYCETIIRNRTEFLQVDRDLSC